MSRRSLHLTAILALGLLIVAGPASAGQQTYIALGDSIAFGETDFTQNPSYGDRGYVSLSANTLAGLNGGIRPNVINLGIDGETSSTFFNGGTISGVYGSLPALQNLNYTTPIETQNALFLQTVAAQQAAGNTVSTISFALGTNDIGNLASSPGFLNLTFPQQYALFQQTLGTIQANYTTFLTEVRTHLPHATVILPGYYDADAEIPGDPFASLAPIADAALNSLIAQEAAAFGGTYVDILTPFTGHIADYTYSLTDPAGSNTHPNALGYSVIAAQISNSVVPEPSSLSLLAIGLIGLVVQHRRGEQRRER